MAFSSTVGKVKNMLVAGLTNTPSVLFHGTKKLLSDVKNTAVTMREAHENFDYQYTLTHRINLISKVANPNSCMFKILDGAGYGLQVGLTIGVAGLFLIYAGDYALQQVFSNDPNAQVAQAATVASLWKIVAGVVATSIAVGAVTEPIVSLGKKRY